jgi:ketosteroid isomerase-like protein
MLEPKDELAIIALYATYNMTADSGDAVAWAATFTDDGLFTPPSRQFAGTQELRGFIEQRTAGFTSSPFTDQQHWNDPVILSWEGDQLTGTCRLVITGIARATGKLAVVTSGRYHDRLVRHGAAWRFAERRLTV